MPADPETGSSFLLQGYSPNTTQQATSIIGIPNTMKSKLCSLVLVFALAVAWTTSCSTIPEVNQSEPGELVATDGFPLTVSWSTSMDDLIVSTPVANGKAVAIWTKTGLELLDGESGNIQWKYSVPVTGQPIPPVITNDYALAPHDQFVDVLSIQTGKRLLQLQSPMDPIQGSVKSLAVDSEQIYVVWGSTKLATYSLATGHEIWQMPVASRAPPDVVTCGESKVCLGVANRIEVYNALSGAKVGTITVGSGDAAILYPVYDGKDTLFVVYNSIRGKALVSLDPQKYTQNWAVPIPATPNYPAAVSDGVVYVSSPDIVLAFDATTGNKLWERGIDDYMLQTPVEFHDAVYVRSESGFIYAIDKTSGQQLGRLKTATYGLWGANIIQPMPVAIDDNILIVPSGAKVLGYVVKKGP
jgi:outer membrane protein assembly factor BamB